MFWINLSVKCGIRIFFSFKSSVSFLLHCSYFWPRYSQINDEANLSLCIEDCSFLSQTTVLVKVHVLTHHKSSAWSHASKDSKLNIFLSFILIFLVIAFNHLHLASVLGFFPVSVKQRRVVIEKLNLVAHPHAPAFYFCLSDVFSNVSKINLFYWLIIRIIGYCFNWYV